MSTRRPPCRWRLPADSGLLSRKKRQRWRTTTGGERASGDSFMPSSVLPQTKWCPLVCQMILIDSWAGRGSDPLTPWSINACSLSAKTQEVRVLNHKRSLWSRARTDMKGSVRGCRCVMYSLLMRRSGLCEQHEHEEHENNKHRQSNPETDDDGVWNERGEFWCLPSHRQILRFPLCCCHYRQFI